MFGIRRERSLGSGNQKGFTFIELVVVIAIIGVLVVTAITLVSHLQARARVGQAQADLRGLYWAVVAFGAHCGSVPSTATAFTDVAPLTFAGGATTCASGATGTLAVLGQQVTDFNGIPAGPFYTGGASLTPPAGWTYTYVRIGTGEFTLTAANPGDSPSPITLP